MVLLLWFVGWGFEGRRQSYPQLSNIFPVYKVASISSAVAAVSELTSVAGLLDFPQLDTPVEPNDGAEGKRRQHAPSSSKNPKTVQMTDYGSQQLAVIGSQCSK